MGSSLYLFMFMHFFFLPSCFHFIILTNSSSSKLQANHLCLDDDRFALLQFNQSLSLNESASGDHSAYPKVASWKLEGDCCSWDGVECDGDTGHVIGLNLSSSFLYGSINSSSSLFSLVHLKRLNLADNDFNYSQIPSGISHLSRLSSLDLSNSVFSGQIPSEILGLSKLISLDLCCNVDGLSGENLLKLEKPSLRSLVQNLTNLEELSLAHVNISSAVPNTLTNLSSLIYLSLRDCALHGEFPVGIFHLPNLQVLSVRDNENLNGYLPEFHQTSTLKELKLGGANFSGKLPDSIGNLNSLNALHLSNCNFSGSLPPSPDNLTHLTYIDLRYNHFTGQIPSGLTNLTLLTNLELSWNDLHGPIPDSFSKLQSLEYLSLEYNCLNGTVEADIFLNIKTLLSLHLSCNEISFLSNTTTNATLTKLIELGLASCNLREFPEFLRFQDDLEVLLLDNNKIQGPLPEWMCNKSKETWGETSLSSNFTTCSDHYPIVLPWASLTYLDLSNNMLEGLLPIPQLNTFLYSVSNNSLSGEITPLICSISPSLGILDLSDNDMSGTIPPCLGNFSNSLSILNLKGNNFQGTIPPTYSKGCNLKMIGLSENQLEGDLPRSLANCTRLKSLELGDNQIEDIFPFWLGTLLDLEVLILRTNKFYGAIKSPTVNLDFPKLRIIDFSGNGFTGDLPLEYIKNWNMMKTVHADWLGYMRTKLTIPGVESFSVYVYSITLTNKGVKRMYKEIPSIFIAVDLSSNKFKGEIPESIGDLRGAQLLNLSNNDLIGCIPSSIANLTQLESLDLSQNKLSGEIPQQLTQLNFLAFFNVSFNHLTGPIPQGKQFNTFEFDSYEGNLALCGDPSSMKCRNHEASTPQPPLAFDKDDNSDFPSGVDWIVIFMGLGSGFVVGFIIGHNLTTRHHEWFVQKFGKEQHKWGR